MMRQTIHYLSRRALSLLLCAVLLMGLIPAAATTVLAAGEPTVTFLKGDHGSFAGGTDTTYEVEVAAGETLGADPEFKTPEVTAETGWQFSGWLSSTDGTVCDDDAVYELVMPSASFTLTAQYVRLTSVTFDFIGGRYNGTTRFTYSGEQGVLFPTEIVPQPVRVGYNFLHWEYANGSLVDLSTLRYPTLPDTETVVKAIWERQTMTVVVQETPTYDGTAKKPAITVTVGETELASGSYTAIYSNNTNATTDENKATVTVRGRVDYSGFFQTQEFDILKGSQTLTFADTAPTTEYAPNAAYTQAATAALDAANTTITYDLGKDTGDAPITETDVATIDPATGMLTIHQIGTVMVYAYSTETSNVNEDVTTNPYTLTVTPNTTGAATVTIDGPHTYTGSAITPPPTVTITVGEVETTLVAGTDYTVACYKDGAGNETTPVNVGEYTAVITYQGNYAGHPESEAVYYIVPKDASTFVPSMDASAIYSGNAFQPEPVITDSDIAYTLVKGTDYNVAYQDASGNPVTEPADAGEYTAVITYEGNYTGTKSVPFTITPNTTAAATVTIDDPHTYTGSAITPPPTVKVTVGSTEKTLTDGTDYTVRYTGGAGNETTPINVGGYTAVISYQGNYAGHPESEAVYHIVPKDASTFVPSMDASAIYSGNAFQPEPVITDSDIAYTLVKGTDYNVAYQDASGNPVTEPADAGEYTAVITYEGNYTGTKSVPFTITPNTTGAATVTIDDPHTYTGSAITPPPTVTITVGATETTLVAGTDYTVACYKDGAGNETTPVNVGEYTAVITYQGNYAGHPESEAVYHIVPKDASTFVPSMDASAIYSGNAFQPEPVITDSDIAYTLVKGTDYNVAYLDASGSPVASIIDAGTYTAVVTYKGNYTGSARQEFTVAPKAVTFTVTLTEPSYVYNAQERTPAITVKDGDTTMTLDAQYTVDTASVTAATNVGTYTVSVSGIGNYEGSTGSADWTIEPLEATLTLPASTVATYDGQDHAPRNITVQAGELDVALGDVVLTYTKDGEEKGEFKPGETEFTDAGEYEIKAEGKADGNIIGSGTTSVTIHPADLSPSFTLTVADGPYTYNDTPHTPDVTVKDADDNELTRGTDYEVYYVDHTAAGEATVRVEGIGNYTGELTGTFTIEPAVVTVTPDADQGKLYGEGDPAFTYSSDPAPLTGAEFTGALARAEGENAGTYAYQLGTLALAGDGAGNYSLALADTQVFTVYPKPLDSGDITCSTPGEPAYTGEPVNLPLTIKDGDEPLAAGEDYVLRYYDEDGNELTDEEGKPAAPTDAGTYYVVAEGSGNYEGKAFEGDDGKPGTPFTIAPKDIGPIQVVPSPEKGTYSGKKQKPKTVTVKDKDGNVVAPEAYDLFYQDTNSETGEPEWKPYTDEFEGYTQVGSYPIRAELKDPNYAADPAEGSYTIKRRSSGGGSSSSESSGSDSGTTTVTDPGYEVKSAPVSGGAVTSDQSSAPAGAAVTLKPEPDGGNRLTSVVVTDRDGEAVPLQDNGNGTFTFTMPEGGVLVTGAFLKEIADAKQTGVSRFLDDDDHIPYMIGDPNENIRPLDNITRAESAMIFYRLLRNKSVSLTKTFDDVPDSAWYTEAVRTLASIGVINGVGNGCFEPNRYITRAEFAAIATRFASVTDGSNPFRDVADNHWAVRNIAAAAKYGWINGDGSGNFRPADNISRAESATVVNHMLARAADFVFVSNHMKELRQFKDLQDATKWYYMDMVEASNSHDDNHTYREIWNGLNHQ